MKYLLKPSLSGVFVAISSAITSVGELKRLLTLALALLLCGCSNNSYGTKLPYDAWRIGFIARNYMEVWIETADAVDINNRVFRNAMSGTASVQTPPNLKGNPKGWPKRPGDGAGKYVYGAELPRLIYVRWQSLAEPKTYEAYIEIPETIRQQMLGGGRTFCTASDVWITDHRKLLVVGLAPGGIAKTWIMGVCLDAIEVSRVQGTVVKEGPHLGAVGARYYRPPNAASQAYIDKFGIPFESW
jgi:hypothetical protein